MKSIVSIISLFVISAFLFCASPDMIFAQDASAASSETIQPIAAYDWQSESDSYKKWGWGLFGTGIGLDILGVTLLFVDDDPKVPVMHIAGTLTMVVGSGVLVSGISVLIAEALKFNPYRNDPTHVSVTDWESESSTYKKWGWGLFGSGLAVSATGSVLMSLGMKDKITTKAVVPGILLTVVGGISLISGVGVLIADAVKYNPYREQVSGFSWQPQFYMSPEMTGFGISGRF